MRNKITKPKNSYMFFNNSSCKYFPCHDVSEPETLNCLFCYCPLYNYGDKCGGSFDYTDKGIKNCINCDYPHKPESYDLIISILEEWSQKKC